MVQLNNEILKNYCLTQHTIHSICIVDITDNVNKLFKTCLLYDDSIFQMQYMNAPSNELKPIFNVLTDLLVSY